jgi:hypothetical protein
VVPKGISSKTRQTAGQLSAATSLQIGKAPAFGKFAALFSLKVTACL